MPQLLEVNDLTVDFRMSAEESFRAVDNVSFALKRGEILGIVGESGSGKTVTALAVMGLLPKTARISGQIIFDGMQIRDFRKIRGQKVTMIFQDPSNSLNPVLTVGEQIVEMIRFHGTERPRGRDIESMVIDLLRKVKITDPSRHIKSIPGKLSGGMNQRVMIAMMSLAVKPELIIADELTSALDVTTQAEILDLLRDIVKELGISLLFITHNLGLVAEYTDRVIVLEKGRVVEAAPVFDLFEHPRSDYTRTLLEVVPRLDKPLRAQARKDNEPGTELFSVQDVVVHFPIYGGGLIAKRIGAIRAVDEVSICVKKQSILGIAGESGCGKTTFARAILGLINVQQGSLFFHGMPFDPLKISSEDRRKIQAVFQDPYQSLNPKMKIGDLVAEGLDIHKLAISRAERTKRIAELLELVSLESAVADRYPIEFSGGQRQRVAIARALAVNPELLILDEPVSSLDVAVQRKILDLLLDLRDKLGLTYIFISHDLAVVREICDEIAVMYLGRIIEQGPVGEIYQNPRHPYTQALLSVAPIPNPRIARSREKVRLAGDIPSFINLPSGCRFHTRCPAVEKGICDVVEPELKECASGHFVACHE